MDNCELNRETLYYPAYTWQRGANFLTVAYSRNKKLIMLNSSQKTSKDSYTFDIFPEFTIEELERVIKEAKELFNDKLKNGLKILMYGCSYLVWFSYSLWCIAFIKLIVIVWY